MPYNIQLTSQHLDDDDLERLIHTVAMTQPAQVLDSLLTAIEGCDPGLRYKGVLTAALSFQTCVLDTIRRGQLTREALNQILREAIDPNTDSSTNLNCIFDRAILLFGIRRSGNHALIEWLKGHFDPNAVLFLNSAEPSLFRTTAQDLSVDACTYGAVPIKEHQTCLIVSYENCDPRLYPLIYNSGIAHRTDALLLLRDFPNTAASITRAAHDQPAFGYRYRIRDFPALWCIYAKLIMSRAPGFYPVLYNDWFKSSDMRFHLESALGLQQSDAGLNQVSLFGQGSSFDAITYDGNAQGMDVLNRWTTMIDDPLFQFLLLAEEEALPLNDILFGGFAQSYSDIFSLWQKR
ncbi:hypothetical protein LC653_38030 [Nostoc sp. CHAB 5784]|uniref:hypothetical protein n=1 Tax=Nostoc mirabile TaxID=2907820 RepID=UPI001E342536|nr:hypothetical protein [Nostoc mirabile]MCC5669480.1 hypothetical protein [Nostoc mirabile CHAB5784]